MPFGSLITTLGAELGPLDKALDAAIKKLEAYNKQANELAQVNLRQGRGGARGTGAGANSAEAEAVRLEKERFALRETQRLFAEKQARERVRDAAAAKKDAADQARFINGEIKKQEKAAVDAAKAEAAARKKADAEIKQSARERFAFIASQQRALEAGARRAERIRTGDTISDLRSRISATGERPMSVQAGDPQAVLKLARQFEEASSSAAKFGRTINKVAQQDFKNLTDKTDFFIKRLLFLGGAVAVGGIAALVKKGIDLNLQWERYNLALSASLALTQDVVDQQGKIVKGAAALSFIGTESTKLFKTVREEANKTILETNELVQVFTENVGNAARAGLTIKQFLPIASNVAQLAKALGLPGGAAQASQEIRAILEGQNLRNATIAKTIGLTTQSIAKAKEEGRLAEFLTEKFKDAQPIIDKFAESATALFSTLVSKGETFLRLSFEKTFEKARLSLKSLNAELSESKVEELAEKVSDSLVKIVDSFTKFVKSDTFDKITQLFELIANSPVALSLAFRAILPLAGALSAAGLTTAATGVGTAAIAGTAAFGAVALGRSALNFPEPQNILNDQAQRRFQAAEAVRNAREQLQEARTEAGRQAAAANSRPGTMFHEVVTTKPIDEIAVQKRILARREAEQEAVESEVLERRKFQAFADSFNKGQELRFKAKVENTKANDERLKELAMVRKVEAQANNDRVAEIRQEAEEAIASAKKQFKNRDLLIRFEAATRAKAERDILLERQTAATRIDAFKARASGNVAEQLNIEARERIAQARGRGLSPEEFALERTEILADRDRKIQEARVAQNEKLTDSYKRQQEILTDAADKQKQAQKDLLDLQRRTEREQRDLIRQRIEAEKELTETIRQEAEKREDIQFARERRQRRQNVRNLLQSQGITGQIEAVQAAGAIRAAPTLGFDEQGQREVDPETVRQITHVRTRKLIDQIVNLVVEGSDESLNQALGILQGQGVFNPRGSALQTELGQGATRRNPVFGGETNLQRGLAIGGLRNQLLQAGLGEQAQGFREEDVQKARTAAGEVREIDLGEQEIKRRRTALDEIDQRQKELSESYRLAAKELNDNLINAFRDAARTLSKMNVELQVMLDTAQKSKLGIPAGILSGVNNVLQRESMVGPQLEAQVRRGTAEQAAGTFPGIGEKYDLTIGFDTQSLAVLKSDVAKNLIELISPALGAFIIKEARKAPAGGTR